MAFVAFAVIRIGSKALKNSVMWSIAILAFVAIFFLKVPFPVIVMSAAAVGFLGSKYWKESFSSRPDTVQARRCMFSRQMGKCSTGFALALSAVAFIGMLKWKWGVISVIVGSGLLGLVYKVGLQL